MGSFQSVLEALTPKTVGMKMFLAFLVAVLPLALASNGSHEGTLRQAIFAGYNKLARPDHQVKWGVGLNLLSLHHCPKHEELDVKGWMRMSWTDERLQWNKTTWNNLDVIRVPWTELWMPDVAVYNGVNKLEFFQPEQINRALIYSTGYVLFIPAVSYKTICKFNEAPQATQNCTMKIGSWTEPAELTDLGLFADWADPFEFDYFNDHQIQIIKHGATIKEKTYDCCPDEIYKSAEFNLLFKIKEHQP